MLVDETALHLRSLRLGIGCVWHVRIVRSVFDVVLLHYLGDVMVQIEYLVGRDSRLIIVHKQC